MNTNRERADAGLEAMYQLDALLHMLRRESGNDGFDLLLRTSLKRAVDLSSVALSVHGGDEARTLEEMKQVLDVQRGAALPAECLGRRVTRQIDPPAAVFILPFGDDYGLVSRGELGFEWQKRATDMYSMTAVQRVELAGRLAEEIDQDREPVIHGDKDAIARRRAAQLLLQALTEVECELCARAVVTWLRRLDWQPNWLSRAQADPRRPGTFPGWRGSLLKVR